jgi:membrane protease YdiL (CAAX protease family)
LLFVAASYLSVYLALPTLLEEIRRGGAELVRNNAGQMGQAMRQSPVLLVLLWGVVVAPVGEELLFRGAVWAALWRATQRLLPDRGEAVASLPGEFIERSILLSLAKSLRHWLERGGLATLVSGALFGLLHWDMPGGQGIIRVTATICLGLACGVARQASGSIAVPIVVHCGFNLLGLAGARRWVVTESFPTHYMVPTLSTLLGAVGLVVAIVLALVLRGRPNGNAE